MFLALGLVAFSSFNYLQWCVCMHAYAHMQYRHAYTNTYAHTHTHRQTYEHIDTHISSSNGYNLTKHLHQLNETITIWVWSPRQTQSRPKYATDLSIKGNSKLAAGSLLPITFSWTTFRCTNEWACRINRTLRGFFILFASCFIYLLLYFFFKRLKFLFRIKGKNPNSIQTTELKQRIFIWKKKMKIK